MSTIRKVAATTATVILLAFTALVAVGQPAAATVATITGTVECRNPDTGEWGITGKVNNPERHKLYDAELRVQGTDLVILPGFVLNAGASKPFESYGFHLNRVTLAVTGTFSNGHSGTWTAVFDRPGDCPAGGTTTTTSTTTSTTTTTTTTEPPPPTTTEPEPPTTTEPEPPTTTEPEPPVTTTEPDPPATTEPDEPAPTTSEADEPAVTTTPDPDEPEPTQPAATEPPATEPTTPATSPQEPDTTPQATDAPTTPPAPDTGPHGTPDVLPATGGDGSAVLAWAGVALISGLLAVSAAAGMRPLNERGRR